MSEFTAAELLEYRRVVVPLDGSSFAEMALEVARQASACFDARIDLAGFGVGEADEAALQQRLLDVAADYPEAHVWTGVDRDVAAGITDVAGAEGPALVCMASHARHGVPAALLRSVAVGVLARGRRPLLLVGPSYQPSRRLGAGPVVVAVDGTPGSHAALDPSAAWAASFGTGLHVVTVAEPVPAPPAGHRTLRHHGPGEDPEGYVEALAAAQRRPGLDVTGTVLYDPVNVSGALCDYGDAIGAGLVVVASRPRETERAVLGSIALDIVHDSAVPVLVVPITQPVHQFTAEHAALSEALGAVVHGLGSSGI